MKVQEGHLYIPSLYKLAIHRVNPTVSSGTPKYAKARDTKVTPCIALTNYTMYQTSSIIYLNSIPVTEHERYRYARKHQDLNQMKVF